MPPNHQNTKLYQNRFKPLPLELDIIIKKIVDSAYTVHKNLGPGLLEKVYEICFCHELTKRGLKYKRQVDISPRVITGKYYPSSTIEPTFYYRHIFFDILLVTAFLGKYQFNSDIQMYKLKYVPILVGIGVGLEIYSSFASPCYLLRKASYNFVGVGCEINNYLAAGLTRRHFNYGEYALTEDIHGNAIYITPYESNYCLTLSAQVIKDLFIGLNSNILLVQLTDKVSRTIYFDAGTIKEFILTNNAVSRHLIYVGASITNFSYSKVRFTSFQGESINNLPVIIRYGANYQFSYKNPRLNDSLKTIKSLVQVEYNDVINSSYLSSIHLGVELTIFEIYAFRAGYYMEREYDYGLQANNNSEISSFTYGFGIQLPLYKLTKLPLNIKLDLTSLPQPSYSKTFTNWDNFTTTAVQINWIFRTRNKL